MKKQTRFLETLPSLLLFFLFSACMLTSVLAGTRVYKRASQILEARYETATCIEYISAKIRHYDKIRGIEVVLLEGREVLLLHDTYEGEKYVTYIYREGAYLMELFADADMLFSPENGQEIMPIDTFHLSLEDAVLRVTCGYGEETASSVLALHSKETGND